MSKPYYTDDGLTLHHGDALTSAGVIADDALIYDVHAIKRWTDTIHPIPGASITLRKHETQETPA